MQNRLPPLQSLLAFEAAARLGGLSRAAVELSLTQSAISHQIQNLETWVGQPLFRRVGRGVKLTAAGELFCDTVRNTLKTLRDGRERIEPYRNLDSVILACPADFAGGWLMPRLPALKARYPILELWLITKEELKEIDRIDVDLIVSNQALESTEVACFPLIDDRAVAVCGPRMAAQLQGQPFPEVLKSAQLIIDEHRPEWAPWLEEYDLKEASPQRSITVDDPRLQLNAAEQELGIAMVSHLLADDALKQGRVMALPQIPAFQMARLWLIKSSLAPRTPAVEIVFEWLLAMAGGQPKEMKA